VITLNFAVDDSSFGLLLFPILARDLAERLTIGDRHHQQRDWQNCQGNSAHQTAPTHCYSSNNSNGKRGPLRSVITYVSRVLNEGAKPHGRPDISRTFLAVNATL
jgi:hypothetical protein